jgi:arylsulfatase A-like enzyme
MISRDENDGAAQTNSNILFIMSDDQGTCIEALPFVVLIMTDVSDLHLKSMDVMPNVQNLLTDQGTFYNKHFCTNALCCPSRVSLLTGKAVQ